MAAPSNKFTDEQIAALEANPYVAAVSQNTVHFTVEFKERFWHLYTKEKLWPREIMIKLGMDPSILGTARIRGLAQNLKKEYERNGCFSEAKGGKKPTNHESPSSEDELRRLRIEVEYLRQESEFLKKIISAGTGG